MAPRTTRTRAPPCSTTSPRTEAQGGRANAYGVWVSMSFGAQERDSRPPAASQRCSAQWDGASEPAWGSAAPATFWLALEQSGAWGSRALVESRLDRRLGAALEASCARVGGRALLIRTISDHHFAGDQPRHVLLSGGMPAGRPWLISGLVSDPARLLRVPWAARPGPRWPRKRELVPHPPRPAAGCLRRAGSGGSARRPCRAPCRGTRPGR